MKIEPKTLKGFRDFLPGEARKRQFVIDTFKRVFESYGFEPLETPVLEYEEVLAGKYGDEADMLMYRFEDQGGRRVAMRYDQTVPLARVVAQYRNELPLPFKRYQIQNVWRAENTQKGRYREFTQCDIDIVGTDSNYADAEIIATGVKSLEALGFASFKVLVNDRKVFEGLSTKAIIIIDKLKKIGEEAVIEELSKINVSKEDFEKVKNSIPSSDLAEIMKSLKVLGVNDSQVQFDPTLARGLDYYTGLIFEIEIDGYSAGSVCGGGRYDNLIGMFTGTQIRAVGCAFGFDRIMDAMESLNLFPKNLSAAKVLVTVFSDDLISESQKVGEILRNNAIATEVYFDPTVKLDKQMKYADKKNIPFVIILGPEEVKENKVTVKNMTTGEQKTIDSSLLLSAINL